jgi:N-acetylmuramoyl-L-alanine amidase
VHRDRKIRLAVLVSVVVLLGAAVFVYQKMDNARVDPPPSLPAALTAQQMPADDETTAPETITANPGVTPSATKPLTPSELATAAEPTLPIGGRKWRIGISAGHGGRTGAHIGSDPNTGIWEDDLNLDVALAVNEAFQARGFETLMNRTTDVWIKKDPKIAMFRAFNPDVLLEFHFNTYEGVENPTGLEVYYYTERPGQKEMAELLAARAGAALGGKFKAVGDAEDPFYVCTRFTIGLLVECAYMDQKSDLQRLDTAAERQAFANACVDAVAEYLNSL